MTHQTISVVLFLFLLSACVKKELPAPKHESGEITTGQVSLGKYYDQQIYFNLERNTTIAQNDKENWDLSFECSETGMHVLLNSSKAMMSTHVSNNFNLGDEHLIKDTDWNYDASSRNLDSTAIGDWTNKNILVDRGYSLSGDKIGYCLLKIEADDSNNYVIKYSLTNHNREIIYKVIKTSEHYFTQLSFDDGLIQNEPQKDSFNLLFTQYTHVFDDKSSYLVTGVIVNLNTQIATMNSDDFPSITIDEVKELDFTYARNTIGYDWKTYDYDTGLYKIHQEKIYIIKTIEGYFYKIHFIDFYNQNGEKGNPSFEFQRL